MKKNKNLPIHIAIIPDGNRRWARKNKIKAWFGHKKGTEKLESMLDVIIDLGISHISFWGSSKDNIKKRPAQEVNFLLNLFKKKFIDLSKSEKIHKNKVKINIFGDWRKQFPENVKKALEKAMEVTSEYNNHFFNFFVAYSGTDEMIDAIKSIAKKSHKDSLLKVNRSVLKSCLLTSDLPPVDLMIRTGGEPHLSDGFMMWDTANAQLYFSEKLWPDFDKNDLKEAINDYLNRSRRFGK